MVDTQVAPAKEPPFVPSQAGLTPPMDDNAVKAIFDKAAKDGMDDLNAPITLPAPPVEQPPAQAPVQTPIPEKFKKPDGTVDEDKLKTSIQQVDQAIEKKTKSIDDMIAEYKAKEKELTELGRKKSEVQRGVQMMPIGPVMTPPAPVPQDLAALQMQIQQDYQRDPIGTQILMARAEAQRLLDERMAPVQDALAAWQQEKRDLQMRENLAQLAQSDPRVLDSRLYAIMNQVLDEDPGMMRLKNPHRAAWNEVKERLRLGEPQPAPAHPSNPAPTLAGGSPPLVSSLPSPATPQTLFQNAQTLQPYSEDGKRFEEQLKAATRDLWQ